MKKETWILHLEDEGIVRPSKGGDKLTWQETIKAHLQNKCAECLDRKRTRKANEYQKSRHEAMTDLGLVRVKGALGGVYYE